MNIKREMKDKPRPPPTEKIRINIHIAPTTFPPYLMIVITAPLKTPLIPQNYEKLYWLIVETSAESLSRSTLNACQEHNFHPRALIFFKCELYALS